MTPASHTRTLRWIACAATLGAVAAATTGCAVDAEYPPGDYVDYPPDAYIATTEAMYFDGHATYWYGGHWYYRDRGRWSHYDTDASHVRAPGSRGWSQSGGQAQRSSLSRWMSAVAPGAGLGNWAFR
jgi:hypothetical protein